MRLTLIRHGETEWSASGQHTSLTDVPLTDAGRAMALRIGEHLAGRDFTRVLTSPRSRARTTCALAGLAERAEACDDLVEWNYGEFEGLTTAQIRETLPGWTVWSGPIPNGETCDAVGRRCDRVIADLRASGGAAAVFGHGHCLRILTARWLGLPPANGRLLALAPASISELGYEYEQPVIRLWNSTAHLPAPSD